MLGLQSTEITETYARARTIADSLSDEEGLFKATWGLWVSALSSRNLAKARDRAEELVTLGRHSTDSDLLLEAFHCRWSTALFRGDTATALTDSREGIDRYDPDKHSWMGPVFGGHDPGVCAHGVHGLSLSVSGILEQSNRRLDQAISLAETLQHPHSVAHALCNATVVHQLIDDYEAVIQLAERLDKLSQKYNFPPQRAHAVFVSGWARAIGQDSIAGLELMESIPTASGIGPFFRYYIMLLAEARMKFGKFLRHLPSCSRRWQP